MKRLFFTILILLLAVSAYAKDVTLSWDPSPTAEVTGYNIYFSSTDDMNNILAGFPIDAGDVLTYQVFDLPSDIGHYIAVKAYNAAMMESTFSNVVYSPGFSIPEPPGGLGGDTSVNNINIPLN